MRIVIFFLLVLLINLLPGQNNPGDYKAGSPSDTLRVENDNEEMEFPLHFSGTDSLIFQNEEGLACLYGDAEVHYGQLYLKAWSVCMEYPEQLIRAEGKTDSSGKMQKVIFKEGEEEMESGKILYNMQTGKGKIYGAYTRQNDLLVYGEEIKKDPKDIIYLKNMKCIPCNDPYSRTIFRAGRAKVIPDDKIVTGPVYLEISGVPTPLALPFGYFPNTRRQKSGILLPFVGNSPGLGLNLRDGGFYWAISNQTDLTLRTDIYTNGSWGARLLNNYYVRYKMAGNLEAGYSRFISGDKDIPGNFQVQHSYKFSWTHRSDNRAHPQVSFQSQVNYISNRYNRLNALNTGQFLTNAVNSNISFSRNFNGSQLLISALHSQNIQSRQVNITFPQLTWNVNRFFPLKSKHSVRDNFFTRLGISYSMEAKNVAEGYDSVFFRQDFSRTLRYGMRHVIPVSTNFFLFKYITITPALQTSAVFYDKSIRKRYEGTVLRTDTIKEWTWAPDGNASLNASTRVYFDYIFSRGKLRQVRHLLIPTLSWVYRPDLGRTHWGWWRELPLPHSSLIQYYSIHEIGIYGGTARGKQNALSLNLNNNIEAKFRTKDSVQRYVKKTWLQNLSINGSYNFAADSFPLSLIQISGRNVFFKVFDWVGNATFDPYAQDPHNFRRIHRLQYEQNGALARFVSAGSAVNVNINPELLKTGTVKRDAPDLTNAAERYASQNIMKWNVGIYYNMNYTLLNGKGNWNHVLNGKIELKPGPFWQFGITTGWDFNVKQMSYTSVDVYRELRCWEFRIQWIPFGFRKGYNFSMNLRNPLMSEFKIPRVRNWYDNL